MDFANKVVLITGASSGIGAACAVYFAKLSANLTLVGRNETNLKQVAKQCEIAKGIKPLIVKADMVKDDDVKRIVDETINRFGQIDVLINNAGKFSLKGILDGVVHYDDVMATNIRSVYILISLAIPYLIETKGNIINMSSVAGQKAFASLTSYCMSKAAMDMYTKCIAQELGPKGLRVNSVNPGIVKTKIFIENGMNEATVEQIVDGGAKFSPLRKIATAEEVAELVVFLASNMARSITGGIHFIDNGSMVAVI